MSVIAEERATRTTPGAALTRQRLKWMLYAGFAGSSRSARRATAMIGGASGASSKAPMTRTPGAMSPPYRRTSPALSRRSWQRITNMSARGSRSSVSTIAIFALPSIARPRSSPPGRRPSPASRREIVATDDHPPGEGGPRRQDGAGGVRQGRRPEGIASSRFPARDRGKTQRERLRWTRRLRPASFRPRRGLTPRSSNSRSWTRTSPKPGPTSPRPRRIFGPPSSISATPKSARRSTATSAIAPPRSAPMSPAAPICSRSSRRTISGSTPISRRTSSSGWRRDKPRRSSPTSCRTMSFTAASSASRPAPAPSSA